MENLSLVLWRERELLDTLLYRLETERLMIAGGRTDRLVRAAGEVDVVLEALRETEVLRAIAADEAAQALGLPAGSSLRTLADAAEEPWRTILHDHRDAFEAATGRVVSIADLNRDLITEASRAARATLQALDVGVDARCAPGVAPHPRREPAAGGRN